MWKRYRDELMREALERHNEAFDRHERAFERFVEASRRHERAFERFEARDDDMRQFMREMLVVRSFSSSTPL